MKSIAGFTSDNVRIEAQATNNVDAARMELFVNRQSICSAA